MPVYWKADELAHRTNEEVIDYISQFHHGHAAQAEMDRRLMSSMNNSAARLERLTRWLIALTVALVVFTAALVILTVVLLLDGSPSAQKAQRPPGPQRSSMTLLVPLRGARC